MSGRRRLATLALPVVLVASVVSACGTPTDRMNDICGDVLRDTALIPPYRADDPHSALLWARTRFAILDRAVSTARETSLPDAAAATMRTQWLEPAVTSLATWNTRLESLRTAVDGTDRAAVEPAYTAALEIGTEGVDTDALARVGFDDCARAFTTPTVDDTTRTNGPAD